MTSHDCYAKKYNHVQAKVLVVTAKFSGERKYLAVRIERSGQD